MLEEASSLDTQSPAQQPSPQLRRGLTNNLNWFYLVALLPAAALLYLILRFTPNLPFWDEFDLATLIIKLHQGSFTFNDFWEQHNEHRIITQKILEVGLAALGGWDAVKEVLTSFFFMLCICAALFLVLRKTVDKQVRAPLFVAGTFLIFSTVQYENQVWGMDMSWFLLIFCVLITLTLTTVLWSGSKKAFFLMLALTLVATYSNSLGIPVWICVLLGMLALRKTWRVRYMIAWVVLAAITLGTYFIGYSYPGTPKGLAFILSHLLDYPVYFLTYMATPWLTGPVAPLVSLFGFAVLIWGLIYNWRMAFSKRIAEADKKPEIWRSTLPWLLIIFFVLANATVTTYGRADLGFEQARSSRYTTVSIWFWISTIVICTLAVQQLWQRHTEAKPKITGASALVSVAFLVMYAMTYVSNIGNITNWYKNLDQAIPYLYDYPTTYNDILKRAYPDPERVRQDLWALDQVNESIFRPDKEAAIKARQAAQLALYNNPAKKLYSYPPELMVMKVGDSSTITNTNNIYGFTHKGHDMVNIYVNAKDFAKQRETSSKNRVLYIQTQAIWYAYINWETGNILNQQDLLYPVKDGNGNVVMAIPVPQNVQNFWVELYYSSGREFNATFKVDMFEGS